jgi:hypothetical protein
MSRACAALNNFKFSSDDSSSSEEDEKVKRKPGDFIGLCLMGKSSRHISDSDVSNDLSLDDLSLRVVELENVLCNQEKLLCMVFREHKKLNLELESAFSKIASLQFVHDDMSAKPYNNYNMIMINYADLWLMHSHVASLLDCARLELRELKAHYTLLGACTSCRCLDLIWRLRSLRLYILNTNLLILLATVFCPLHAMHMALSRINISMLPKRTPSLSRMLLI